MTAPVKAWAIAKGDDIDFETMHREFSQCWRGWMGTTGMNDSASIAKGYDAKQYAILPLAEFEAMQRASEQHRLAHERSHAEVLRLAEKLRCGDAEFQSPMHLNAEKDVK